MSELDESAPLELAGPAGDAGAGRGPEVGERGPAGFAEQAAGAGDSVLQGAGDAAGKAESVGGEGLQEAGKLAGEAQSAGREGLQEAGKLAGGAESAGREGLQEAGKLAGEAQSAGGAALQKAGDVAGAGDHLLSGGGRDDGPAAETGESGPAGHAETGPAGKTDSPGGADRGDGARAMAQVDAARAAGQLSGLDMVQPTDAGSWDNGWSGDGWNADAVLETGESGPAGSLAEAITEIARASVEVAAEGGDPDDAAGSSGDSAQVASSRSGMIGQEAALDRLEQNLSPADLTQRKGQGR